MIGLVRWFLNSSPFTLFILQHSLYIPQPVDKWCLILFILLLMEKSYHYIDYLFLKYMLNRLIWFGHPFFHLLLSSANGQISYAKAMLHLVLLHSWACLLYSLFDSLFYLSPLLSTTKAPPSYAMYANLDLISGLN